MTEILNLDEVVAAIRTASDRIANGVAVCDKRYVAWLEADGAYDKAFAQAFLGHEGPQTEKRYAAEVATADLRHARDVADAAYRYADRQARALDSSLRAWQSVGKAVVAMYSAAGVTER